MEQATGESKPKGGVSSSELWDAMEATQGRPPAFTRNLLDTPGETPPPIIETPPGDGSGDLQESDVPTADQTSAAYAMASGFAPIDESQRLPPAGLFSNRQHRGDTIAENGTPLTGVGTPGMLINDSATASPNPHEHYAAINQAVMDKAYAKLFGDNFVYYIQTMSVVLGRRTKAAAPDGSVQEGEPDVDLGASKSISRKHATIRYDTKAESFFIQAHGKNGMQVDLVFYKAGGQPIQLFNGSRIQIANVGFWFFLPQGSLSSNTPPLALATQLHLRYLASRSPSPASVMTQPNSRAVSRHASPEPDARPRKKSGDGRKRLNSRAGKGGGGADVCRAHHRGAAMQRRPAQPQGDLRGDHEQVPVLPQPRRPGRLEELYPSQPIPERRLYQDQAARPRAGRQGQLLDISA